MNSLLRFRVWLLFQNVKRRLRRVTSAPPLNWAAVAFRRIGWWKTLVVTSVIGVLAVAVLTQAPVVIDQISVPAALTDLGYDSDSFRQDVLQEITRISEYAESAHPSKPIALHQEVLEITIPETPFSIRGVVDLGRWLLNAEPTLIKPSVVAVTTDFAKPLETRTFMITLRVSGGGASTTPLVRSTVEATKPEHLSAALAEEIIHLVNPYILASYAQDQGDDARALKLIEEMKADSAEAKWAYLLEGWIRDSHDEHDAALRLYEKALALDSAASAHASLWRRGRQFIRKTLRDSSANLFQVNAHYNIGVAQYGVGVSQNDRDKLKTAVTSFTTSIDLDPSKPYGYSGRAIALSALKQHDQAVADIEHAISLAPTFAWLRNSLGEILANAGQVDKALEAFDEAVGIDPDFAESHYNRGEVLSQLGKKVEARSAYETAVLKNPKHAEAQDRLGLMLSEAGEHREAVAAFRKAIAAKPELESAHIHLGNAFWGLGCYPAALESYERATDIAPRSVDGYIGKGQALASLENYQKAIDAYRKSIELDSKRAEAHFGLARSYAALNRHREAIPAFQKTVALRPDSAVAWTELGKSLGMSSQFREALDAFMQAIQHDQAEPANYYFAGFTFEAGLQNRIEALRYYRKALSLDSMDPDFYRMLAVAFDRLDERDDSNAALRKAVAVGQSSATPPSKVECGRL